MILAYNLILLFVLVLASPCVIFLLTASRKHRKTVLQRLGIISSSLFLKKTPSHLRPIWIHALSVGEVLSAVPFAKAMKKKYPDRQLVFSSSTLTGFETASRLLKNDMHAVIYFPYDLIFSVRSLINRINPALVIIVETDIWPNFLFEMKKRSVPVVLVNARMSESSFSGYRKLSRFSCQLFQCFSKICVQTRKDASRFQKLGVLTENVLVTGNLKYDMPLDIISEEELQDLKNMLLAKDHQQCIVAGSTHPGEEAILLDAFSQIKTAIPAIYMIIAPRDIERSKDIRKMAVSAGLSSSLFTEMRSLKTSEVPDVVVIDTIGHLKRLYGLSDLAFIGGSLIDFGGHNPVEPAAFKKPVVFGPYTSDFTEICSLLVESGGAKLVHSKTELVQEALIILQDTDIAKSMGRNAYDVLQKNMGALEKNLDICTCM